MEVFILSCLDRGQSHIAPVILNLTQAGFNERHTAHVITSFSCQNNKLMLSVVLNVHCGLTVRFQFLWQLLDFFFYNYHKNLLWHNMIDSDSPGNNPMFDKKHWISRDTTMATIRHLTISTLLNLLRHPLWYDSTVSIHQITIQYLMMYALTWYDKIVIRRQ